MACFSCLLEFPEFFWANDFTTVFCCRFPQILQAMCSIPVTEIIQLQRWPEQIWVGECCFAQIRWSRKQIFSSHKNPEPSIVAILTGNFRIATWRFKHSGHDCCLPVGWNLLDASQGPGKRRLPRLLQGALTEVLWEIAVAMSCQAMPSSAASEWWSPPTKEVQKGRGATGCSHQRLRTTRSAVKDS